MECINLIQKRHEDRYIRHFFAFLLVCLSVGRSFASWFVYLTPLLPAFLPVRKKKLTKVRKADLNLSTLALNLRSPNL